MIRVETLQEGKYVKLNFELERPIEPKDLKTIIGTLPKIQGKKVLLISGRGPIWLYCALLHEYLHKVAAIGTYDPKIQGYVIVASHHPDYNVGDVILS